MKRTTTTTAKQTTTRAKTQPTPPNALEAKRHALQDLPEEMGSTIWLNTTEEHRQLYATELRDGKLICYLDRNCIFEFSTPPSLKGCGGVPLIAPQEIQTIAKAEKLKGIYHIMTTKGGCWYCYLLERQYTPQDKWQFAELNCQHLEKADSWLLGIPVSRLREIRSLPFACYHTLPESERFYWITVQERRGDDGERLRHAITMYEKQELEERISNPAKLLKDAVSIAGIATKSDIQSDGNETRETVKKHGKKPPSKKVIARARKGGLSKAVIDAKHKSLFLREWDYIKNKPNTEKARIIANRCAKGDWKHDPKIKTPVKRKDGEPITARNVSEFIKRHKT